MKWNFTPQLPSQVETEVTQRDQFSNDELQLSQTIVRESIQNSLDAGNDDDSQITVTFRWLDKSNGLSSEFLEKLFDGQINHAEEAGLSVESVDFDDPRALVIEDFGTKGLTGSVDTKDDDNFSDFWRRHGKSHKTGRSRGRWGLGKLVYSTTSQLGVFFGATIRAGDPDLKVMGQTVLNLRTVDGCEYPPHGFFADIEGDDPYTKIPVPLKDKQLTNQFIDQFSLERADRTGLSVIIPFPNRDFNQSSMIAVAIENYFYPIITGQLVLKFNDQCITKDNIRELALKYDSSGFNDAEPLFDFIEEVHAISAADLLEMKPSWSDDGVLKENDFDSDDLEVIRESFVEGKLVALKLPITILSKNNVKKKTSFSVFIKRPVGLEKGRDLYVRGGLTLPGESKFKERKAFGAMIAEDEVICSFLGDAENPSHTQWIASAEKLKKNYRAPEKIIKVIRQSVVQLYDMLAEVTDETQEDALRSFFWADDSEVTKPKKKKNKSPIQIPLPPQPKPKYFSINKIEEGFNVVSTESIDLDELPQSIRIEVAYDVTRGNPWKKYSPLDFKLGTTSGIDVKVESGKATLLSGRENLIRLKVSEAPFKLSVKGFDINRDLKIKLNKEG